MTSRRAVRAHNGARVVSWPRGQGDRCHRLGLSYTNTCSVQAGRDRNPLGSADPRSRPVRIVHDDRPRRMQVRGLQPDPESFLHLAVDQEAVEHAAKILSLPLCLSGLGVDVSTGPVVDFRAKECLRDQPEPGTVPLVYPTHLRSGSIV